MSRPSDMLSLSNKLSCIVLFFLCADSIGPTRDAVPFLHTPRALCSSPPCSPSWPSWPTFVSSRPRSPDLCARVLIFDMMSREFWFEFLQLYRNFPCLWDTKDPCYVRRDVKREAYDVLLAKVHEVDTTATIDSVKKKIDSFRTAFRREQKKVILSMQSGATDGEIYCPSLWYYRELEEFLGSSTEEGRKRIINTNDSYINSEDDGGMTVVRNITIVHNILLGCYACLHFSIWRSTFC